MEAIWQYTFRTWSRSQADKYIDDLFDAFELLATNPAMGKKVYDVREGYRRLLLQHHLIFYRISDAGDVDIIRILNERVDVRRHLSE